MLQQWSRAQNLRISCNCWSFVTTTASFGAALTSRVKPFWTLHESTNSTISSLVLLDFCLRHKSYILFYELERSALVKASSKLPELLTNLSNIAFLLIPLWNSALTLFLMEISFVVTFLIVLYWNSIAHKNLKAVHRDLGSIWILLFYGNHDKLCGCR